MPTNHLTICSLVSQINVIMLKVMCQNVVFVLIEVFNKNTHCQSRCALCALQNSLASAQMREVVLLQDSKQGKEQINV